MTPLIKSAIALRYVKSFPDKRKSLKLVWRMKKFIARVWIQENTNESYIEEPKTHPFVLC